MEMCIISTAQQARPKVIHISEPVRAQVIRASEDVTRNPLSESSLFNSPKKRSSLPTGLPVAGSMMPFGFGATRVPELSFNPTPALLSSIRR